MNNFSELAHLAADIFQLFTIYNQSFALQFTQAFRPVLSDYQTIFQNQIALQLFQAYESQFWSFPQLCSLESNDPNRTEVRVICFSTQLLKDADEDACNNVPGGYSSVIPFFNPDTDIPMLKLSFVEPTQPYGIDFDGFYFINHRFIWIPKPWRFIETFQLPESSNNL